MQDPQHEPHDEVRWMAVAIETIAVIAALVFAYGQAR
jgi:hypothetical protein